MPELDSEKPVGDEPPAKAARMVEPSPDGDRRSSSGTDGSLLGGEDGAAQNQPEAVKDDDTFSEANVGGHQVQDHPRKGALRVCPAPKHVLVAADSLLQVGQIMLPPALSDTEDAETRANVASGLQLRAQRIRTFPEGKFEPSAVQPLLVQLTDELLVTASDVASRVGAEEPAISGNSIFRLLAWTVADACGAGAAMDKPLALIVGRRLDSRAQTVRAQLEAAATRAQQERAELESNHRSPEFLAAAHAEIDADEQVAIDKARHEVYIGFHELHELIPDAPEAQDSATPVPEAQASSRSHGGDITYFEAALREMGCYFPWVLVEAYQKPGSAMPPDLAKALGREGVQALFERQPDADSTNHSAEQWWTVAMPHLIRSLLREIGYAEEDALESKQSWDNERSELKSEVDDLERELERKKTVHQIELDGAHSQIDRLTAELHFAKGREEALYNVIDRCRWSTDGLES